MRPIVTREQLSMGGEREICRKIQSLLRRLLLHGCSARRGPHPVAKCKATGSVAGFAGFAGPQKKFPQE